MILSLFVIGATPNLHRIVIRLLSEVRVLHLKNSPFLYANVLDMLFLAF